MVAITKLYECKHLQTYEGLKTTILNINSQTAADTIDLAAFVQTSATNYAYKNTKTIVDADTAQGALNVLDLSMITTASIRFAYGVITTTGAWVPIVASSTATLTLGAGPSSSEIELVIEWRV